MSNLIAFKEMQEMAACVAQSGLFGLKAPSQVLALMVVAQAEGRHPGIVARDYHIVGGKPTLKADAMLARFQESGGKIEWHTQTHERAEATFSHPAGGEIKLSWTIEDANRAGLIKKDSPWEKYPRAMLRSRLISEAIRTIYPGVICGTYTTEEVESFTVKEKDITPHEPEVLKIEKQKATEETLLKLDEIIQLLSVSTEKIHLWCKSDGVESLNLISEEFANKIIAAANEKLEAKKQQESENE
jgi:hypothetical protein